MASGGASAGRFAACTAAPALNLLSSLTMWSEAMFGVLASPWCVHTHTHVGLFFGSLISKLVGAYCMLSCAQVCVT